MWRRTVTDHMISHLTGLNCKPMDKGTVLHGYSNPKPIPIPGHTRYQISTVLPGPMSHLTCSRKGVRKKVREWQQLAGWINCVFNVYPLLCPLLNNVYSKLK